MEATIGWIYRRAEDGKLYEVTDIKINKKTLVKEIYFKEYGNKNSKIYITSESYFFGEVNFSDFKYLDNAVDQKYRFERVSNEEL